MAAEIQVYFGEPDRPLFGWWHRPEAAALDTAVLLCPPYGREEVSGHRSLRRLAQQLAQAGLPVLRFDYLGTGDSADAVGENQASGWQASIGTALDELKRLSGARHLAVVGLRVGALLAAGVAAQRGDVSAFVAWASVTSGRAFVRELKALQAAAVQRGAAPADEDLLESGGYAMNAATRDGLSALDLKQLPGPPAPRLLVIDRDDLPSSAAWLQPLTAAGCAVEQRQVPGYAAMMQDPHNTQVPQAALDAIVQWLAAPAEPAVSVPPGAAMRASARMGDVIEEAVSLEVGGARLNGILSRPADEAAAARDAVLLLNAGAQRRIGPSRLYVRLARQWAQRGALVLRLDIGGLGDSRARPGAPDNVVYSPSAVEEAAAAVAWLRNERQARHCTAVGLCAGAYHSLKLAVRGAPVDRVVAINPLTFFWHEGTPLDAPMAAHEVASEMARYRADLFARERWMKLLRGQVDLRRLGSLLAKRVAHSWRGPVRDLARLLRLPLREDLAAELRQLAQWGIGLHFVFSKGDPGEELLHNEAGALVGRLRRRGVLALHRLEDADHTLTGAGARERASALLTQLVMDPVFRPAGRPRAARERQAGNAAHPSAANHPLDAGGR